jgi:cell division control protein 6
MTEHLFEAPKTGGIFKNLDALGPHYIPDELPHRLPEAKAISRVLSPVLGGEKPSNVFVYGSTGTGKTCVVKHVIRELNKTASGAAGNAGAFVRTVYMNCRTGYGSKYQVLVRILADESLQSGELKSRPLEDRRNRDLVGLSPTRLYEKLKDVVRANNLSLIVILDEIDTVKDVNDLMYMLTRINDDIENSGRVSVIGISNLHSFKEKLDARSKSTLCEEELVFKSYNAHQLETILKCRAEVGLKENAISDGNLKLIAAYSAQSTGDARYALKLLQKSAEMASMDGRDAVKVEDVKAARLKVETDVVSETVKDLPEHKKIVLYGIADLLSKGSRYKKLGDSAPDDVVFSGEAYDHYTRVSRSLYREPITIRWFREYLNQLEVEGLVILKNSGKGVRGNTTLIRLGRRPEEIKSIIEANLGLK